MRTRNKSKFSFSDMTLVDIRISDPHTSDISSSSYTDNNSETIFTSPPILESSTNLATQETTETSIATEQSTIGYENTINNTVAINVSSQLTNLTHNTISPFESNTLQLDNNARERIFVILNKSLLNSLRNVQNDTYPNDQENNYFLFPQINTNDRLFPTNVTTRDTKHNFQDINQAVTVDRRKVKSKKVNTSTDSSSLGNILAQFFMQAIGVNNRYNPYNSTNGVAISKNPDQGGLKDLVKIWKQNRKQSFKGFADSSIKLNEVESSNSVEIPRSNESTLTKLTGLKLEESLNKRIQRESNLLSL